MYDLTPEERDLIIRTVLGEAAGESPEGRAAVIHVILNRARSGRFPDNPADVATQGRDGRYAQFSAWNDPDRGGNRLPHSATPEDRSYREVGTLLDQVLRGEIPDPTGGAIHYYSPRGMPGGRQPWWWEDEMERQGGGVREIGAHRFISPAGAPAGAPAPEREGILAAVAGPTPEGRPELGFFERLERGLGSLFGLGDAGPARQGPDPNSVERLRAALEAGDIGQDTYEQMYARLLLQGDDRQPGMGLSNISEFLQDSYQPPRFIGTSLSTSPLRGRPGSGTSAIQRLGVKPLA
jgi:hypothetical protein